CPLPQTKKEKPFPHPEKHPAPKVGMEPPAKLRGPLVVYQPMNAPDMMTLACPVEDKPPAEPTSSTTEPVDAKNWGPAVEPAPAAPEPAPVESLPSLPEPRSPFLERHQARLRKRRGTVLPLRPLGWINGLFDRLAVALGGPFLWFIRPEARSLLGWVGTALLLAALVILVGVWLGWSWPS